MTDYLNPYFLGSLYFLCVWLVILFLNKNDRKEQFLMSLAGALLGPFVQIMHLTDWWAPKFLFANNPHIEDIIFGFAVGGIVAVAYNVFFVKKYAHTRNSQNPSHYYIILLVILSMFALFGLFYFFNIHSFWSSIISCSIMFLFVAIKRHDLIVTMFVSGIIIMILAWPAYIIGLQMNPNWIESEWALTQLSGLRFFEIPVEEFIWFFFVGLGASAIYELVFSIRYVYRNSTKYNKSHKS